MEPRHFEAIVTFMCAGHAIVGVEEMPALMAVMAALELISIMSNATTKSEPTDSEQADEGANVEPKPWGHAAHLRKG